MGHRSGGTVEIDIEGASLPIRPVAGSQLREEGDLLVIPRTGTAVDDRIVREFVAADRYRD